MTLKYSTIAPITVSASTPMTLPTMVRPVRNLRRAMLRSSSITPCRSRLPTARDRRRWPEGASRHRLLAFVADDAPVVHAHHAVGAGAHHLVVGHEHAG